MKTIRDLIAWNILFLLFFSNHLVSHAQSCIHPPAGMLSWWDGDDVSGTTATDIIGSNNATLVGGASTTFGKVGDAFNFDGSNDHLDAGFMMNYTNGATFDAWVKTADNNGVIISDGGGGSTEDGMGLFLDIDGTVYFFGSRSIMGSSNFGINSGIQINDGEFHFVAGTWTGNTAADGAKLYIDGVLVGTATANQSITTGSTNIYAGGHGTLGHHRLDGLIDEIEVFDRVLTPCEIEDIYLADTLGKCKNNPDPECINPPAGMLTWWDGDDVSGTTATDIIGSNNGSLVGGASTAPGKVGEAFDFDGSNDHLDGGFMMNYTNGATFDAWVKTTDNNGVIISDGGGGSTEDGMGLFLDINGTVYFFGSRSIMGSSNFGINSGIQINDGEFHFVAATWTGNTAADGAKLYIDGVLVGTATANQSITTGSTNIYAGGHGTLGHHRLDGLIDEIEIFDTVLSACDIYDIFMADTLGKCKPSMKIKPPTQLTANDTELKPEIYPNPSSGKFTVSIDAGEEVINIYVVNNLGRTVFAKENTGQNMIEIDISDQPKGIYFVRILAGNKESINKLIHY